MAIGPKQVLADFDEQAKKLEKVIDSYLLEKQYTVKGNKVLIFLHSSTPLAVQRIIAPSYILAGWTKMEFFSDQKEGHWVELTNDPSKLARDYFNK